MFTAQASLPITGGQLEGKTLSQENTEYTISQLRNVTESVDDPTGGKNGDVWIKYTA